VTIIDITGNILNTGYGEIKVLGGYANIDITNTTPYDLVLNRIDASKRGAGTLIIKDKAKEGVGGSGLTATIYQSTDTGIVRTTDDGSGPVIQYLAGNTDTYSPADNWRYGWSVGVDSTTYVYDIYATSAWLGLDALSPDPADREYTETELAGEPVLHTFDVPEFPDRAGDTRGVLQADFELPGGAILTGFAVHFPAPYHPTPMRIAAYEHDWDTVERLLAMARAEAEGNQWVEESLGALEEYARRRETQRFAKEAHFSSVRMSSRLASRDEISGEFSGATSAPGTRS